MRSLKLSLLGVTSIGLMALVGCSGGTQTTTATSPSPSAPPASPASSTPAPVPVSPAPAPKSETTGDGHGKGGQVIETGDYHLELLTLKEPGGMHIDFYLLKGAEHSPVSDAKVTGQVQLPDGTQQTLEFKYSADDKHYTAILPSTAAGEYKLAVLSDIKGEKVNGRFTFSQ